MQREWSQTVVQILAKLPLREGLFNIHTSRHENPCVNSYFLPTAGSDDALFLQSLQ